MDSDRASIEQWIFDELESHLATTLEAMAGTRPTVSRDPIPCAPRLSPGGILSFSGAASSTGTWLLAAEDAWTALGRHILGATGIDGSDPADQRSSYLAALNPVLSGMAKSLTGRFQREFAWPEGKEADELPAGAVWATLHINLGDAAVTILAGFDAGLLDSLVTRAPARAPLNEPQTFDLLLDVELPVSVSFGRAQVPLKDVLKLTTGSIVELDRAIVEPVDVLVNNCVIARGEVVVVEGNFGVRIQHVVSRQERLRTLQ